MTLTDHNHCIVRLFGIASGLAEKKPLHIIYII